MKKMLEIEGCKDCCLVGYDRKTSLPFCERTGIAILKSFVTPSWCPLPDAVSGWREMDSAPKDGTNILLCDSSSYVGWWDEDDKAFVSDASSSFGDIEHPNYWRPLPTPPVGK